MTRCGERIDRRQAAGVLKLSGEGSAAGAMPANRKAGGDDFIHGCLLAVGGGCTARTAMRGAHCATSLDRLSTPRETSRRQSRTMPTIDFELRGDFIALDALLKATGLAPSGGSARQLIVDGQVTVDGEVELRKTAKIRGGRQVRLGDMTVRVSAPAAAAS
jgi:ribosome-associated protein